jgi:hypothetical protein
MGELRLSNNPDPLQGVMPGGRGSGDTIIGEMPDPSCVNITQNIDQLAG